MIRFYEAAIGEDLRERGPRQAGFDVPYSTSSVCRFDGGIADNVVPEEAHFTYEFRDLPGGDVAAWQRQVLEGAAALELAMRSVAPDSGFRFDPIAAMPSFQARPDEPAVQLAQRLAGTQQTTLVAFGTEAGLFQRAGMSAVVCGPGSINQAHQADEYVSLEQLARCEAYLQGLAATAG